MFRLGYIDEDAGQRNQFYQTFKGDFEIALIEGYEGITVEELIQNTFDNHVDILIIDYEMEDFYGYNGDKIARSLNIKRPNFPVLILTSHEGDALDFVDDANIVNGKDIWSGDNIDELGVFKKKLISLINNSKNKVIESEEKLKKLEAKRISEGLEPNDEDEYVRINNFLNKEFDNEEYLSGTFYSENTNKRLDDLIQKTEQLLQRLPNKL